MFQISRDHKSIYQRDMHCVCRGFWFELYSMHVCTNTEFILAQSLRLRRGDSDLCSVLRSLKRFLNPSCKIRQTIELVEHIRSCIRCGIGGTKLHLNRSLIVEVTTKKERLRTRQNLVQCFLAHLPFTEEDSGFRQMSTTSSAHWAVRIPPILPSTTRNGGTMPFWRILHEVFSELKSQIPIFSCLTL